MTFTWLALTCNLRGADVYFGFIAGIEDALIRRVDARQIEAHPVQSIKVASHDLHEIPLCVYAVHDETIVRVARVDAPPAPDGFHRVRLHFRGMARSRQVHDPSPPRSRDESGDGQPHRPKALAPVVAYLLTIGLRRDDERDFYDHVVKDFVQRSFMSMPALLQEIGCSSADDVAHGDAMPCHSG
jgi:hypothetical protein